MLETAPPVCPETSRKQCPHARWARLGPLSGWVGRAMCARSGFRPGRGEYTWG